MPATRSLTTDPERVVNVESAIRWATERAAYARAVRNPESDVAYEEARITTIRRLWAECGTRPYVRQMEAAFCRVARRFPCDFYQHDLECLERYPGARFVWLPYESGSHICCLDGVETEDQANDVRRFVDFLASTHAGETTYLVDTHRQEFEIKSCAALRAMVRVGRQQSA